jgi:hypothetical protein
VTYGTEQRRGIVTARNKAIISDHRGGKELQALFVTMLTCWCCALLATPRRPRLGNEVEELVYSRLLGRHHLLIGFAAIVTALTVLAAVVTLPRRVDATLGQSRALNQYCAAVAAGAPSCYRVDSDGRWAEAVRLSDGEWEVVTTVPAPPAQATPSPNHTVARNRGG